MLQRLKWLFIAFIWILQVKEMFINGLPVNGTFSSSISTNNSADSLNTSLNTRANQSESLSNRTTVLDSFQINTWYQSRKEHQALGVNLVLLPVGALVCFLVMISLRFCTWQREDQKFKERGCSYDVTNYVILIQGDADYSDVDIRSETLSNYDTVNSYVSGVPKSPWRAHSAMPSYVSLQSRIDSQMYDTVTSYRSYLQSPHGRKAFNFDKKDIIENDKIVNSKQTPQRPRKIPGTRFSIVPALDNYMRLKSLNKSPSQPASPKLLRMASESPDTLSSNESEIGAMPRRNKKSRVSFTEKSKDCGQNRRPRKCKMVDAQTQVGFRRSKRASQKSNSTTSSSTASETVDYVNNGGETKEKSTSVSQESVLQSLNSDFNLANNIKVKAEVYNVQKFCSKHKVCDSSCDQTVEGNRNLQNCYLTSQNDKHSAVKGVSEATQFDFVSERIPLSVPVSNDYTEIQINITENPYGNVTPPKEQTTTSMTSSLLCCPSIPPKTKSETDLFKNNNNNSSMENLCRRKSCDIIQKSRGKNAKISPIGIHKTRCFCDNKRKFSLGAISNDTNSVFKSKNIGTSLSSLKDVLNIRKKNCEQNGNLMQKSESRTNVETV
ncbi:uncharacterized protein LOC133172421 [Saccostrea echinata]|uniref:uncharacterized protein LOC133172421 n=1 Tax=Saccostrea echinata TaxID=191078 RepID=UPI002A824110|nr:uncharacterized protein LOC133172421 [Saccostrea echinata]XP_061163285.1 uncharacterized protein LOC133172421 [Saccostrea echinata]XP_061163286.1 uncharacterized protein LOC133172421 [Saccostrea echinata]